MPEPEMKTYRCPTCNITIEVTACVISVRCDGGGKHRSVQMVEEVDSEQDD